MWFASESHLSFSVIKSQSVVIESSAVPSHLSDVRLVINSHVRFVNKIILYQFYNENKIAGCFVAG